MKTQYIKPAAVKRLIKEVADKRTAKEFLMALDAYVERAVRRAAAEHNGGKRTVDASVAGHTLGTR
jgi:histone H3/H4